VRAWRPRNLLERERADEAVEFVCHLTHTKGRWAGVPFDLRPWQEHQIIRPIFGRLDQHGHRVVRTAYVEVPRKNGKALDVETQVCTPGGWTTMGELSVGDAVYAPDGSPTAVVGRSPVFHGEDCYEVELDSGARIVAGASHRWTEGRGDPRVALSWGVTSTESLAAVLATGTRVYLPAVMRPGAAQFSKPDLIVDVRPVPRRPIRCIQVAHASRCYLAGRGMVPTHNSETAAAVALKLLFADGERGGEVYGAALDRDQATIVFNVAAQMVRNSPVLSKRARIIDSSRRIVVTKGVSAGSFYRAIPGDAAGSWGFNASGIVFDELHVQPNRELWDALTTSTVAREQPLTFGITTAGYDRESLCWELHEYARQVTEGLIDDPSFLGVIYGAQPGEDWTSPATWRKANPNFRITVPEEYLAGEVAKAKQMPAYQNTVRRLHLNEWTSQAERWLDMRRWNESAGAVDERSLLRQSCYAGLDLASTEDVAALVLVFPPTDPDGAYRLLPRFWVPEENLVDRGHRHRVPYQSWVDRGLLKATQGDVIDFDVIVADIAELGRSYRIEEVAFDRWGAAQVSQQLQAAGFVLFPFGQGFASFAAPTREFSRLVVDRKLHHGSHPILNWMADNVVVDQDAAGNLKPNKKRSRQKIDGIVAAIMGLDRALRHEHNRPMVLGSA
jgi:phage terminase large subunit-like protein